MEEKQIEKSPDYISLSDAAKTAGCTPEHLNLMVRKKNLQAVKLGRNWFTTQEWLNTYLESVEKMKNSRRGIIKIRKVVDNYLGLADDTKKTEKVIIKYPVKKSGTKDLFIQEEDTTPIEKSSWKKSFISLASALTLVIIFLAVPVLNNEISRNSELEKTFKDIDSITFFNEDQGLVKGEETEAAGISPGEGAILASENFKIKQIRFGGFGAEASVLSDENITLEIENVRGETFLTKKQDESRLLISWTTNKLAISEIEYATNDGRNPRKIKEPGFGFNHGLVIPGLELGTAYIYRIKAKDRWGNVSQTGNYAVYSGAKAISVIELITKELEKMFGWAKGVQN